MAALWAATVTLTLGQNHIFRYAQKRLITRHIYERFDNPSSDNLEENRKDVFRLRAANVTLTCGQGHIVWHG